MSHLSPIGTAVLTVFLIMALVCPLILIKFWGPKHGAYGRRGKREWDDDDQYDRRRRKKRGTSAGTGSKKRRKRGIMREEERRMEEGEVGNELHMRYRPEGDWTSATSPTPLPQAGQMYAGAYGLPPPGHGNGHGHGHGTALPLGRSEDNRGNYTALPTGSGTTPGTPPPATPAPRYTPGGYRAPSSQPHTPSGLRCASLPHLAEEEELALGAGTGSAYAPIPQSAPYMPPSGDTGQQSSRPTSPAGQSHSSWLRKSSNALGRPLELVIGPARSQGWGRHDNRGEGVGVGIGGGAAAGGEIGGQVQQLGEWKKGVPLRPLEAVVSHPERAGEVDYLPLHTSQAPFIPQSKDGKASESYFALPTLPIAQPLFDRDARLQGGQRSSSPLTSTADSGAGTDTGTGTGAGAVARGASEGA